MASSSLVFNPTLPLPLPPPRSLPPTSIRCSNSEGPIRRPSIPVKEAASSPSPSSPPPLSRPAPPPSSPPPSTSASPSRAAVTVEYQRQRAKELQEYFLDSKYEKQASEGRIFGWTPKNEINNGRWAMFGIAVGLLTEYATGSNFVDQLKIIVSNLGIADLE